MNDFVQLSDRMSRLPPYLFGRINRQRDEKRRAGIDVIDMAMGNPTDATPAPIVEKLCEVVQDPRNHRYSVGAGIYNLRREVAKYYEAQWGVELDPEHEVIATIGSKEGFSHLCLALLGPGDTALVPTPSFPIHTHAVVIAGASYLGVPVGDDEAFLRHVDETCRTLRPSPKVLFLNYPHNPSAHTVDPEFFVEAVKLARKYHLIIVHDFAYGKVCFDDYRAPSFLRAGRKRRRRRVHDDVEDLQHGRLAYRLLRRQPEDRSGTRVDQGLLRLRDLPGDPDRLDHRPPPL